MDTVLKKRSTSDNSRTKSSLGVQDLVGHSGDVSLSTNKVTELIDRIVLLQKSRIRIKRIVVCTHAKFSTLELCRALAELGVHTTYHPVDYSREQHTIEKLVSLGVQVIDSSRELIPAIQSADCAIEDGARISKIIDTFDVKVGGHFFSVEQTSGGVRYFQEHPPKFPVINVAMSPIKLDIENKRATPEKVIQHFSEATGKMLGGKRVLILGFGSIGQGLASLARVMGASITIYDTLATKRMFAKHQGYETVEGAQLDYAMARQDVILMATNRYQGSVIGVEQLLLMKDGAIICNAGSGRGELCHELQQLGSLTLHDTAVAIREEDGHLAVTLSKGNFHKNITILGKAFPLNLHVGKGTSHDAIQIVMSLLLMAATTGPETDEPGLHPLSTEIQETIAQIVLNQESRKLFEPKYVESGVLSVTKRPYGGVFVFHDELSHDANMSVIRAWFKAGSKTRGHYHLRSQEAFYVEKGTADLILWPYKDVTSKKVFAMKPGDYLLIPEGYFHDVNVTSTEDFECLVIATPPFQMWDQFFAREAGLERIDAQGNVESR
jgi:adenosylhomocysteinase